MVIIICLFSLKVNGQVGDFTTALPIIKVETGGVTIPDEPRIKADLLIINHDNGVNNSLDAPTQAYNIEIETRGNSSLEFPKKSFRIETQDNLGNNLNISLLGLPPENDWILYGPYNDKSMIRNAIIYQLSNQLGHYAPRTVFCELIIDGYYWGIYLLTEKIKRDENRVDIAKLTINDISGDELTGGYILSVDWDDENNPDLGWYSEPENMLSGENTIYFQFDDPGPDELMSVQSNYIKDFIWRFENELVDPDFKENMRYQQFIDIGSFVDFMLLSEISKNVDAYKRSVFLYKEKDSDGGKLKMGPIWDYDLAFGNVDYSENAQYSPGWMYSETIRMYWFRRLLEDPFFSSRFECRWLELRSGLFSDANINHLIDSTANLISGSVDRNFTQFPVLGIYVWPNQFVGETYEEEIEFLRYWVLDRLKWMDENMVQDCVIASVEEQEADRPKLYPNPFNDKLTLKWSNIDKRQLNVFDARGRLIFNNSFTDNVFIWDGLDSNYRPIIPGMYVITVADRSGSRFTQKVIHAK